MEPRPRSDLPGYVGGLVVASLGFLVPLGLGHLGGHFEATQGITGGLLYFVFLWAAGLLVAWRLSAPAVVAFLLVAAAAAVHLRHEDLFVQWPASLVPWAEGYARAALGLVVLYALHLFVAWLVLFSAHQYRPKAADTRALTVQVGRVIAVGVGIQLAAVGTFFVIEALPLAAQSQQAVLVGSVVVAAVAFATRTVGYTVGLFLPVFLAALQGHVSVWAAPVVSGRPLAAWVGFDLLIVLVVGTLVFAALVLLRVFLGVRPPRGAGRPESP